MRTFALYTLARLALFAAAYGLIWLIFGRWLTWSSVSALYTAIVAMVVSSLVALLVLGRLRDRFAADVSRRADRAKAAFDAMRAAEDTDEPPPNPQQRNP
ncbi:MAG: hypothetical protein QOI06_639 [Nocardioidaceae bacterium]|jgi:hypothetical protein|nr:hypothetical protein [Nocardioidaceae bacterium]